jgi:hypothetical protein
MAREGAGEATALSPDGVSIPMELTAIAQCFASDVSAHGGGFSPEHCTVNAAAITAIVVVVLHLAVMLCRPTVLP